MHISLYRIRNRFIILTVIFLNIVLTVLLFGASRNEINKHMMTSNACVRIETLNSTEVPVNRSIFFVETNSRIAVEFTARQACSVESAARLNPDRLIYVLFLSHNFECQNDVTAIFSLVSNYHNIRLRHIDIHTYIKGTPFEDFVRSGIMGTSKWIIEHYSDMLRILTLWKFGGIYMDLDVVSLKPMPLINFFGAEYPGICLSNCIIGLQSKDIAEKAIQMFKDGWDGEIWIKNGPFLVTNLMKERCGTDDISFMYSNYAKCHNFTVYPPEVLSPIAWYDWKTFFDSSQIKFVQEKIKNSMTVHFWNKLSKKTLVIPKSNQPYADIANKNCPKVFSTVINHF